MSRTIEDEDIIQYLLGNLSEEDRNRVEERFVADADYYEYLESVEEELISDYLRHRLSAGERKRFEKYFLASRRNAEKMEIVRDILAALSLSEEASEDEDAKAQSKESKQSGWSLFRLSSQRPRFGFAMGFLLGMSLILLPLLVAQYKGFRFHRQMGDSERAAYESRQRELQQQIDEMRATNDRLEEQLLLEQQERDRLEKAAARQKPPQSILIAFAPAPASLPSRAGGDSNRLSLPSEDRLIRMRLEFADQSRYKSYRVKYRQPAGIETVLRNNLRAVTISSGKAVIFDVSSKIFAAGDFVLTLYAVTEEGEEEVLEDYPIIIKR